MKRPNKFTQFRLKAAVVAIAACFAQAAQANPTAPTVANGSATFATSGSTLSVTNTPGAIINWQQFNIGQGEITKFIQQSAQSTVLNRVLGQDPSQILGTLQSNGRVFLVNPSGVLFGQGSVINVNGLVASTLNISDSDFLLNRLNFIGGNGGSVVNQGNITTPLGGSVYLIGNSVKNEGVITSPKGEVILAAGNSVSLLDTGTPHVTVTLNAPDNQTVNLGQIVAEGGNVNIYGALINQQGVIRADSASLDAQGNIVLKATDIVTASGTLSASGTGNANGGRILLMSDMSSGTVHVSGTLDASSANANGGFIETSAAHVNIADGARITTSAPHGKTGTWLIDPIDFTIASGLATQTTSGIGASTLSANLGGNNISIVTDSSTTGNGDIFVIAPISWSSSNTLSLQAHRNIEINSPISSIAGGLTLTAANNVIVQAGVNVYTMNVSGANIYLYGSSGKGAELRAIADQTITASNELKLVGASTGHQGDADISSSGNQTISANKITLTGGGAATGDVDNYAKIHHSYCSNWSGSTCITPGTGNQTINLTGASASITATGGSGSGKSAWNYADSACVTAGLGDLCYSSNDAAVIYNDLGTQTIAFANTGGAINLYAGNNGVWNDAGIRNQQWRDQNGSTFGPLPGEQKITNSPDITLTGGSSGGYHLYFNNNTHTFDNSAGIETRGSLQTISARNITLNGSASGASSTAVTGAFLGGDPETGNFTQNITATGNVTITGGASGRVAALDSSGSDSGKSDLAAAAGIYADAKASGATATSTITVGGNLTMTGGASAYSPAIIGSKAGSSFSVNATGGVEIYANTNSGSSALIGSIFNTGYVDWSTYADTIQLGSGSILNAGTGRITLQSPTVVSNGATLNGKLVRLWTNKLSGTGHLSVNGSWLQVESFMNSLPIVTGVSNDNSACGSTQLCLTDQLTTTTGLSRLSLAYFGSSTDGISINGAFSQPATTLALYSPGIILNAALPTISGTTNQLVTGATTPDSDYYYPNSSTTPTYPSFIAYIGSYSGKFVNNAGTNAVSLAQGYGYIYVPTGGTYPTANINLGGISATKTSSSSYDLYTLQSAAPTVDPCTLNPALCVTTTTTTTTATTNLAPAPTVIAPVTTGATGDITYAPDLKLASASGEVTYSPQAAPASTASSASTTNGSAGSARVEAKKADVEAKKAETEAKEAEAQVKTAKTPQQKAQAKKHAEEKKAAAEEKKAEAEVKKAEAEVKEAEAEAKTAKTSGEKTQAEVKKSTAEGKKAEAEGKKAEVEAKKADAEMKQAEGDAKKAEAEAKVAKTPEAKALAKDRAEASKAEAQDKKADVSVKKAEAEVKKAEAEVKKAEVEAKTAKTSGEKTQAEVKKTSAEGKKAEAESKKAEAEAKKADVEVKQAEGEAKKAEAEAKVAKTPEAKAIAKDRAEASKSEAQDKKADVGVKKTEADSKKAEAEVKKAEVAEKTAKTSGEKAKAEVKKTEAESKKADADSKKADAESKKADVEAKKAEGEAKGAKTVEKKDESVKKAEAKKAESDAKKAESDAKKAESEAKKAEGEAKKAEGEAKEAKSAKTKAEAEKKAETKKAEAESKKAEAEKKKGEEATKKAEAQKKEAEHKKAEEHRKEVAVKSFSKAVIGTMNKDTLKAMLDTRHEYKADILKPALTVLDKNPAAADMPACGAGGGDLCIQPQRAAQVGALLQPVVPTLSFLPQIQRKVAVVIGINQYQDKNIPALEGAVPDADAVGKMFKENMGYDVRVVHDATKADIVKAINQVASDVGPNDSVTVYYAGHGYQTETTKTGYWIPSDGSAKSPSNWISNSDVNKMLSNIPAKQVMLVSDSCFSGSLAKEQKVSATKQDALDILGKRSVLVMSSGGEEPVSDEGRDGHSVFAWHFMDAMKKVDRYEQGSKLYDGIKAGVAKDGFPQAPQYGAAVSAGHATGGDYLFEVRKY